MITLSLSGFFAQKNELERFDCIVYIYVRRESKGWCSQRRPLDPPPPSLHLHTSVRTSQVHRQRSGESALLTHSLRSVPRGSQPLSSYFVVIVAVVLVLSLCFRILAASFDLSNGLRSMDP